MFFAFGFFVFIVLATASPQAQIKNEIEIPQLVNSSLLNGEPSGLAFDIDEDQLGAIENFLTDSLRNYPLWLAKEDPVTPDPTEIRLNTRTLEYYDEIPDLQAILYISNQYMANHSKPGTTVVRAIAQADVFSAGRSVYDGLDNVFGGDYNVKGSLNVSDTLQIPFSGQGRWTLKGNELTELLTTPYIVDENGYIQLANSNRYTYIIFTWNHIEFEGLQFDYNGDIDGTWMPRLKEGLTEMYNLFLRSRFSYTERIPTKRLFKTYLQERFESTKLDDIISGWQPTTTDHTNPTDTYPTTPSSATDSTSPPDTGNANKIFGCFWMYTLTLIAIVLLY